MQRKISRVLCFVLLLFIFLPLSATTLRIALPEFDGYCILDEQGELVAGYGYDYLIEMKKYLDYDYDFVFGSWAECQEMLYNGEVDLLTAVEKTDDRLDTLAFSENPMGVSYCQLTVHFKNKEIIKDDYTTYDGCTIGLVRNSKLNENLLPFSKENNFTFIPKYYDSQDDLLRDFEKGTIDLLFTSSLRSLREEKVLAQIEPAFFYIATKIENDYLLNSINDAMVNISLNTPGFRYELSNKYYGEKLYTNKTVIYIVILCILMVIFLLIALYIIRKKLIVYPKQIRSLFANAQKKSEGTILNRVSAILLIDEIMLLLKNNQNCVMLICSFHCEKEKNTNNFSDLLTSLFNKRRFLISRFSETEYVVFSSSSSINTFENKAREILKFARQNYLDGSLKCSIGIAKSTETNENSKLLYKKASKALLISKNQQVNGYVVYQETD